jgi:WD40 repeat protein
VQVGGAAALHSNFLMRLAGTSEVKVLVEAADEPCRRWWRLGSAHIASFAAEHLLYHLDSAHLRVEAVALVFRLPWLQFVLRRRGALALIADIERFIEAREDKDLLVELLRISRIGLLEGNASPDEAADSLLPGQIVGRLSEALGAKWPATLGALRGESWNWRGPRSWIRPMSTCFEAPGGPLKAIMEGHNDGVTCVSVMPDSRVVSGSIDTTLRIWEATTGVCERVLEGHTDRVSCVVALSNTSIVSGSHDATLRVWDTATGTCEHVLKGHSGTVKCMSLLSDGRVVSGSWDKSLCIWNTTTGACLHALKLHSSAVSCVSVLSDDRIVSGSWDETLCVWSATTGACECVLKGHTAEVECLSVLSNGRVVSGSYDCSLRMWNTITGQCERVFTGHTDAVKCLSTLSDGHLVSGSRDQSLGVWSLTTSICKHMLTGHTAEVVSLSVLSDGLVVSGSYDRTVRVWNIASGKCDALLEGHTDEVESVTLLGENRIVSGSRDKLLRVCDARVDAHAITSTGHTLEVEWLSTLGDSSVVSCSIDNTLRIWDATTGECLRVAKRPLIVDYRECLEYESLIRKSRRKNVKSAQLTYHLGRDEAVLTSSSGRIHVGSKITDISAVILSKSCVFLAGASSGLVFFGTLQTCGEESPRATRIDRDEPPLFWSQVPSVFVPEPTPLGQVLDMLNAALSPDSRLQREANAAVQSHSEAPLFVLYLAHILVRLHAALPATRQIAGFALSCWSACWQTVLSFGARRPTV